MLKSFHNLKKILIELVVFVFFIIIAIYVIVTKEYSSSIHIDKDYFTMNSKVEIRDLPWSITPEEAKEVLGELDTTFDVESEKGINVIERLMPKKQIHIDELDISTEVIRLMFNMEGQLISIDYYFLCKSEEELNNSYNELNKYLSNHISSPINKIEKDSSIKWIDYEGNSLTMRTFPESQEGYYLEINLLSADHRIIHPNE